MNAETPTNKEDLMSTAFRVVLTGDQEVTSPPGGTGSEASGLGTVIFDSAAVTASYSFTIEGVDFGPVTGGSPQTPTTDDDVTRTHFHTAAAGVNGPIVFGQIDTVDPAFEQDDDDLDVVLNADGSWSVSGVWDQDDPPRRLALHVALQSTISPTISVRPRWERR